ncbi:hypothetical protein KZY63_06920 [Prevotella histicola]|uniref:hypothetical protein n=1 Tax=Prevotella histicola TaxID=470565 RepID=UPI001C5EBC97|nr:hypothetical protein [Prevotella histicola]MBW4712498.1 hypothetical protein [Prevotella histicola]MBW4877104.1 hypothetical protein [Prevotella histicola]MBW4920961.1 hypothetical protein [Prevotella histicola]
MKKNIFFPIACALMAAPLLTSCQDDVDSSAGENSNTHTYSLVVDASEGLQQAPASRALTEDASHSIKSSWANEDEILTYVINDGLEATNYSIITNKNLGNGNRFDGEIASKKAITTSSQIAFLYPGKAAQGNDKTITPVVLSKERSSLFHEESDKTQELVALNLTQQDGTAETIGNRFDFQWAKQSPKSVSGKKVNVNIGKMKRLVTIWGLRFTDDKNKPLANIDSIYVSNVKGSDVLKLSDGTFVDDNPEDEMMNVVLKPKAGKFSSVGGNYTYVAFLPGTYEDVVVTAYVGGKVYQKSYSSITFGSDKIYRTDLLKMEDTKQKAFVEVQGIKWATGNFIHYKEGSQEYWGIAPTQWWISDRAVMLNSSGREVSSGGTLQSSQFDKDLRHKVEDIDLFRYGSIAKALKLTGIGDGGDYWGQTGDISKQLSSDGKHGDIVWYYTKNNHRKYRMPTGTELESLYKLANVIPAYCYTDKGTIVYGAFFTTNASNDANKRKKAFPTKAKRYDKYTNVTALVRANKGLFLPVTGRRLARKDEVGFRDMSYGLGAYGQYMASTSAIMCDNFFFGPTEWNFAKAPKGQATAIRPILDSDDGQEDPAFAPFANIK